MEVQVFVYVFQVFYFVEHRYVLFFVEFDAFLVVLNVCADDLGVGYVRVGGVQVAAVVVIVDLVGLGVGNMEPDVVSAIISHGLKDDKNIRLIDTAHVSRNEFLVAKGIVEGVDRLLGVSGTGTGDAAAAAAAASDVIVEVHVITKIWYTSNFSCSKRI